MASSACFHVGPAAETIAAIPLYASFPICNAIISGGVRCHAAGEIDDLSSCLCNEVSAHEIDGCLNEWRKCTGTGEVTDDDVRATISQWHEHCGEKQIMAPEDIQQSPESPTAAAAAAAITNAAPFRISNSSMTTRSTQHPMTPSPPPTTTPSQPSQSPTTTTSTAGNRAAPRLGSAAGLWSYLLLLGAFAMAAQTL